MDGPSSVSSVVDDVAGPGFAFDVYQDAILGALEVHRDDRWQVSFDVLEREEVSGESSAGDVVDWSDVFVIGWVLTGARDPNDVGVLVSSAELGTDVLPQIVGHRFWQLLGGIVQIWDPVEDLVELQEYAGALLLEVVSVCLGAGAPLVHRNFADLALWWWGVERAVDTVIFFLVVWFQELIDFRRPGFNVSVVGCLVPNQCTLYRVLLWHRSEAKTWIGPYQRFTELIFWHFHI